MVFHFFNVVVGLVSRCIALIFRLGCLKERKAVGNFQFIALRVINLVLSKLFNQNPSKSLPNKLWTRQNYIHFLFPIWILQFSAGRHIWPDKIGPPGGTAAELANWEFQNVTGLANECNKASFVSPFLWTAKNHYPCFMTPDLFSAWDENFFGNSKKFPLAADFQRIVTKREVMIRRKEKS